MRSQEIGFAKTSQKVFTVPKGWTYALTNAVKLSIQQVRSTFSRICNRKKTEETGFLDEKPTFSGKPRVRN